MTRFQAVLFVLATLFLGNHSIEAFEKGDFLVRVRAIDIAPIDSSGTLSTIPEAKVSVKHSWSGELNLTSMLTRNWSLELILTVAKHKIRGRGSISSLGRIGTTWILPPTLFLQHHFFPCSRIQPYVGLGVNYTLFWSERTTSALENTRVRARNSWGIAGQIGTDIMICDPWFFNLDLTYIDLDTRLKLKGNTSGKVSVDINPLLFGVGIGRKF